MPGRSFASAGCIFDLYGRKGLHQLGWREEVLFCVLRVLHSVGTRSRYRCTPLSYIRLLLNTKHLAQPLCQVLLLFDKGKRAKEQVIDGLIRSTVLKVYSDRWDSGKESSPTLLCLLFDVIAQDAFQIAVERDALFGCQRL